MDLNYSFLNQDSDYSPILILHGLFGSQKNWASIAKKLAEKYPVITVDLRNHGQSPHAKTMSFSEMTSDIIELLNKLDQKPVILIGHSMGGKVAMNCALDHPDYIKALCVVDIAPVSYPSRFDHITSILKSLPLDQIIRRSEADQFLSAKIDQPLLRLFLLQNLIKNNDQFSWRINLNSIQDGMTEISGFPEYSVDKIFKKNTLFIRGENSDYVLPEHHSLIKNRFTSAKIETIPNCGHWLHAEQPDLFYDSLLEFLDENAN